MVSFTVLSLIAVSTFNIALARPPFKSPKPKLPYSNVTISKFSPGTECVPFEDPHCCVDAPVCECVNGTFFSVNTIWPNGTSSFCGPPGNETYGGDASSIPGWCC